MEATATHSRPAEQSPALDAANEAEFNPRFGPVRRLMLDYGATRVNRDSEDQKSDELWQGDCFDPMAPLEQAVPVYLRVGHGGALVAELTCSCIARALGLPTPEVFIVEIPPGRLPGSAMVSGAQAGVCVATRDIGGSTFAQLLSDDEDAAMPLLRHWPELGKVVAFDEWLANLDRNLGNLIYVAQTLHIIDHAEALGGSCRALFPLAALTQVQFSNRLAGMLQALSASNRSAMLGTISLWLSDSAAALNIAEVIHNAGTGQWNKPEENQELIDFITQRLTLTHALLCKRLGHPQLALKA